MYPHHTQSIQNVAEYFQRDPEVLAMLLGGSIAHGFESRTSDVDIMILVSNENHQRRFQKGEIHFYNKELCTYEGGYVDGKYLSLEFVKQVAAGGSEPGRFDGLHSHIERITDSRKDRSLLREDQNLSTMDGYAI
jgi:predicted nucleotidyltransferase